MPPEPLPSSDIHWIVTLAIAAHLLAQVGLAFHVIMRRLSLGETLAWSWLSLSFL